MEETKINLFGLLLWTYKHPQALLFTGFALYTGFIIGVHVLTILFKSSHDDYEYDRSLHFLFEPKAFGSALVFCLLVLYFCIVCINDDEWLMNTWILLALGLIAFFASMAGLAVSHRDPKKKEASQSRMRANPSLFRMRETKKRQFRAQINILLIGVFLIIIGFLILIETTTVDADRYTTYFLGATLLFAILHTFLDKQYSPHLWMKAIIFLFEIVAMVTFLGVISETPIEKHTLLGFVFIGIGYTFSLDIIPYLYRKYRIEKPDNLFAEV